MSRLTGTAKKPVCTKLICFLQGQEIHANTTHLDDDHIETTIFTRSLGISMPDTEDASMSRAHSPLAEEDDDEGHGKASDGTVACCRQYSEGQVNCDSCLNAARKAWAVGSNTKEQEMSRRILDVLDHAGPAGLDISTLIVSTYFKYFDNDQPTEKPNQKNITGGDYTESVLSTLSSLMNNPIPLVVLVGHSRALAVSARHSEAWTVTVSEEPRINVVPRRWLDSTGVKVQDTWRAALRAVIGIIVFRPGISQVSDRPDTSREAEPDGVKQQQAEIAWRLRSVYERIEVVDVLRQLFENGFVERRVGTNKVVDHLGLVAVIEEEEKEVYWFLSDRSRWYRAPSE